MIKLTRTLPRAALTALLATAPGWMLASGAAAAAHHEAEDTFNLATMVCWDLTDLEADDRAFALVMVYGYVAGVNDMPVQSASHIGAAFERIGRLCDANPDMYVSSAIKRALNPTGE